MPPILLPGPLPARNILQQILERAAAQAAMENAGAGGGTTSPASIHPQISALASHIANGRNPIGTATVAPHPVQSTRGFSPQYQALLHAQPYWLNPGSISAPGHAYLPSITSGQVNFSPFSVNPGMGAIAPY